MTPPFIVVTGGPGSGKSTLIDALASDGHRTSPETGRAVIRDQLAIDGTALPWRDRALFAELMLDREIVAWRRTEAALPLPAFFDRGIADVIGYLRLEELDVSAHFLRAAETFRYHRTVFLAPHWPEIYMQDTERRQSADIARRTCDHVAEAWARLGHTLVELPLADTAERIRFMLDRLREDGDQSVDCSLR